MNTPGNTTTAATLRRVRSAQAQKLRYFALTVQGEALAPRFNDNQIVAIDTEKTPEAGDVILTEIDGAICLMAMNGDNDLTDNKGGYVPAGTFFIIGVAISLDLSDLPPEHCPPV